MKNVPVEGTYAIASQSALRKESPLKPKFVTSLISPDTESTSIRNTKNPSVADLSETTAYSLPPTGVIPL
jgi:hypothetical protein